MVIYFQFIFKLCVFLSVCFISGRSAPMTAAIPAIALWRQMHSVPTGSAVSTARCLTIYPSIYFSLSPRLSLSRHLYCDSHLVCFIPTFSLKSAHHLLFLSLLSNSSSFIITPSVCSWSRPAPCAVDRPAHAIYQNTAQEVRPTAPLMFTCWTGRPVSTVVPTATMACVWPMSSSACSYGAMVRNTLFYSVLLPLVCKEFTYSESRLFRGSWMSVGLNLCSW